MLKAALFFSFTLLIQFCSLVVLNWCARLQLEREQDGDHVEESGAVFGYASYVVLNVGKILLRVTLSATLNLNLN
jgi:hypothetical protein